MLNIEFSVIYNQSHCQLCIEDSSISLITPDLTFNFPKSSVLGCSQQTDTSFNLLVYKTSKFEKYLCESTQTLILVDIIQHFAFDDLPNDRLKKKFLVFLNPISGRGRSADRWRLVRHMFEACEVKVVETRFRGHALEFVRDSGLDGVDGVVCVGGDGLVHEVVNGLCLSGLEKRRRVPVGVVPAGSGNALAQFLCKGKRVSAEDCAYLIIKGNTQKLDVNEILFEDGKRVFSFLSFSWGYIAEVDTESDVFRCCGIIRYDIYGAWRLLALRRYHGTLKSSRYEYSGIFTYFWVCTLPYVGEGMLVAPNAVPDDGLNNFMIMKNPSRYRLARVLLSQDSGKHLELQGFEHFEDNNWSLDPQAGTFSIDGDFYPAGKIEVKLLDSYIFIFG